MSVLSRLFFWSPNSRILVWKLCLLFQTILYLWLVLILEVFSSWDIKEGQFQFLVTFLAVFFWSVDCTNQFYISSHILKMAMFEHRKCFIWVFLVFSFLVFSIFKYLKSTFLAIFPDLKMLQFWSVNYLCQVCKLYFYFGHVRNFGQYLYLSVFSKHCDWYAIYALVSTN